MEDLEQRAIEVLDHLVVSGESLVGEIAKILPDRLPPVPIGHAQVADRVIGKAVEAPAEGLVVDLPPHGQQPGRWVHLGESYGGHYVLLG